MAVPKKQGKNKRDDQPYCAEEINKLISLSEITDIGNNTANKKLGL